MSDYPPRVEKSENIYKLWETGEGDMGELAIGLYDLTAHYKALWDDYAKLEAENKALGTALYHAMYAFDYHIDDPRWANIEVDDEREVAYDASLR